MSSTARGAPPSPDRGSPSPDLAALNAQAERLIVDAFDRGDDTAEIPVAINEHGERRVITRRAKIDREHKTWEVVETVDEALHTQPAETHATTTARVMTRPRQQARSRESHRTRLGQRRTRRTSAARSPDDDSGPSSEPPPPLPFRIAGPANDPRAQEAAFLAVLNRRHPSRSWSIGGSA